MKFKITILVTTALAVVFSAWLGYVTIQKLSREQYKHGFELGVKSGSHAVHVAQTQYKMGNLSSPKDKDDEWILKDAYRNQILWVVLCPERRWHKVK